MFFRTVSRRVGGRQRRLRLDEPRQQEFGHLGRGFRGPVRAQRDRVDQRLDHREHGRFRRRREAPLGLDVQVQRRDRRKRRLRAVGDAQHARTAPRDGPVRWCPSRSAETRARSRDRASRPQPPRRVRRPPSNASDCTLSWQTDSPCSISPVRNALDPRRESARAARRRSPRPRPRHRLRPVAHACSRCSRRLNTASIHAAPRTPDSCSCAERSRSTGPSVASKPRTSAARIAG